MKSAPKGRTSSAKKRKVGKQGEGSKQAKAEGVNAEEDKKASDFMTRGKGEEATKKA